MHLLHAPPLSAPCYVCEHFSLLMPVGTEEYSYKASRGRAEHQHCCSGGRSPRAGKAVAAAELHRCWGKSTAVASCVMSCWGGGKIEVLGVGGRPESFGELGRGRLSPGRGGAGRGGYPKGWGWPRPPWTRPAVSPNPSLFCTLSSAVLTPFCRENTQALSCLSAPSQALQLGTN